MKLRVLVPVDVEEPRSWINVLPQLRQHITGNEVDLSVVTVVPELGTVIAQAAQAAPLTSFVPAEWKEKALALARERLEEIVDADDLGDIRHIVRSGSVYSEILQTAEDIAANLIVVMSHIPDLGDYLLGPNAAKIVRHAKCSVLVVRPE
ncbi:universal stress protein [Ruegeria sp. Ofav3-42]|uniref:universal stress protein n=1 Tax=Ruegeria sp. Ofav3-42 TaxID=2917759 RepID=UPI001EF6F55F|nr:universal stress protein [Ruegeria sp. Ofav3-42]MCG7522523.1 universal stress protein [Ruegeria sp. Ofav3-42]